MVSIFVKIKMNEETIQKDGSIVQFLEARAVKRVKLSGVGSLGFYMSEIQTQARE